MNIEFNRGLKNIDGSDMMEREKDGASEPSTLKLVAVNALLSQFVDEQDLSGNEKADRYNLAMRINGTLGATDLKVEEIALIKKLVGKAFSALIVGQAYQMLETELKEVKDG